MSLSRPDAKSIRRRFEDAGQGHLFAHLEKAAPDERDAFFRSLDALDLDALTEAFTSSAAFLPPNPNQLQSVVDLVHRGDRTREAGENLLAEGRVGCLLVAGGHGSRLGFPHPKGMLSVSRKTLFERFCAQILKLQKRYGKAPPLYVMTSRATHDATVAYFRKNDFFGLPSRDVAFFEQGEIPTFDLQGKLLLQQRAQLLRNPDGHGGMLEAAQKSGMLHNAEERGLTTLYFFQVDNPLVKIADPCFLGIHEEHGADFSLKVVLKTSPGEKLGVPFLIQNLGRKEFRIVEYSDLPQELQANDFGSIAIHAFRVPWLKSLASKKGVLPWHRARKKVEALDEKGNLHPTEAVKLERFIFDLLPHAKEVALVETKREEEFAPIKNPSGPDSLETAEAALARAGRNE